MKKLQFHIIKTFNKIYKIADWAYKPFIFLEMPSKDLFKELIEETFLYYISFFSSNFRKLIEYFYIFILFLICIVNFKTYYLKPTKLVLNKFFIFYNNILSIINYDHIILAFLIIITLYILVFLLIYFCKLISHFLNKNIFLLEKIIILEENVTLKHLFWTLGPAILSTILIVINLFYCFLKFDFHNNKFFFIMILFTIYGTPIFYILFYIILEKFCFPLIKIVPFSTLDNKILAHQTPTKFFFKFKTNEIHLTISKPIFDDLNKNNNARTKIIFLIIKKLIGYFYLRNIHGKDNEKIIILTFFYGVTIYNLCVFISAYFVFKSILVLILLLLSSIIWLNNIIKSVNIFHPKNFTNRLNIFFPAGFLENLDIYCIKRKENKFFEINPYSIFIDNIGADFFKYTKEILVIIIVTILIQVFCVISQHFF